MVGTIELNAGPKIACPAPYTTTIAIRRAGVSRSVSARTPTVAIAMPRMTSPAIIRCRRSSRSARTPLASMSTTCGRLHARPTIASRVGESDSSYDCHATATR
jgi:hypothetical protein